MFHPCAWFWLLCSWGRNNQWIYWKCYLFHVTPVSSLWPRGSVCLFLRHSPAIPHWEREREAECVVGPSCAGRQGLTWNRCGKGDPPPNLPPSTTTRSEPSAEGAQLTGATSGWCLKHLFKRCQCRTTQEKNTRIGLYVHVQKWKQVWHDSFLGCAAVRDELDIHDRIVLCN